MTTSPPPSARERIGGRWAISLRGYAVICVLIAVGTELADATALGSGGAPGGPPLFIVAQCLLTGVVLLVGHFTVFRHRSITPVHIWVVVALGVVVALLRPACSLIIRAAQGQQTGHDTLLQATITTVVISAILMPALAYAFATRAWYTGERARLIARDVQIQADRLRASGAIDTARDLLSGTVNAQLDASRMSAASLRASGASDAEQMADLLMQTARESVRPLSHDLWATPARPYPSMSWRQVVACEARRYPLPILVPSAGFIVIATPLAAATAGWPGALVLAAVAAASVGVVFRLGRALIRSRAALTLLAVAGAVLIAPAPIVAVGAAWFGVRVAAFAPAVVLLALLLIAGGAPAAANETADSTIAQLQAMVAEHEVQQLALDQENARMRRELAAHLHGTLQPRLVNASHAVREAALVGDPVRLDAAMRDAEIALASADDAAPAGPHSLAQVVDTAQHDWSRLLDITWDVQVAGPAKAPAVADVIRESLANAVVHGHATEAVVQMVRHGDDLVVTVADNGIGPQRGDHGLGAEVLDDATARRWTLQPRPGGGSVLTATLSAYGPTSPA